MELSEELKLYLRERAKLGGQATLAKHGKEYFVKLSKQGVEARRRKNEKNKRT